MLSNSVTFWDFQSGPSEGWLFPFSKEDSEATCPSGWGQKVKGESLIALFRGGGASDFLTAKVSKSRWQGIHVLPLCPFPQGCPSRSQERGQGMGPGNGHLGRRRESCEQPRTPLPVEKAPGVTGGWLPRPLGASRPCPCRGPAALTCPRLLQSSHLREVCPAPRTPRLAPRSRRS